MKALEGHADELKDKVVLDVGCGTGILSMFAARAGARKVYAVDASGITRRTQLAVKENGGEDVIEVITARMEEVTKEDIPEPVDCVVSEWMGYALFFESMLPSVVHARDAFMRPDGLVLPNVADVRVALLSDEKRYDDGVAFWDDVYGFDFSSLAAQTKRDWSSDPPVATVDASCIVSDQEGALVVRVDCAKVPLRDLYRPMAGDVRLVASRDCVAHGLCLWFDVDFYGRAFLSTSPSAQKTHWYQTVLMFDAPRAMREGDALVANIELEPGSDPGPSGSSTPPTTTWSRRARSAPGGAPGRPRAPPRSGPCSSGARDVWHVSRKGGDVFLCRSAMYSRATPDGVSRVSRRRKKKRTNSRSAVLLPAHHRARRAGTRPRSPRVDKI